MARTTSAAVLALFEDTPAMDTAPFIETASHLIDRVCATAVDSTGALFYDEEDAEDIATLELVERWLSAHFLQLAMNGGIEMEKAGSVSQSFRGKVDLGLMLTFYGQQAVALDVSRALALHNKGDAKRTVRLDWLGTTNP